MVGYCMPPQGHRTITIREKDYDYFQQQYEREKDILARNGIRSFSAFITMKLYRSFDDNT